MNNRDSIHLSRQKASSGVRHPANGLKIFLYSHDSYGLGHLRRNLSIARALLRRLPDSSVLIVTGSPCATQFSVPERCDIVKVPAVGKNSDGDYVPRSLNLSLNRTIAMRRQLISGAYETFEPDIILVDHQPAGLLGEMLDTLKKARKEEKTAIFGMRDIVDAPSAIESAWCSRECRQALEAFYDHIVVYGDKTVFDPVKEYPLLDQLRHKVSMCGYSIEPREQTDRKPAEDERKHVLVTVGGGDDGERRIETYLQALLQGPFDWKSRIVAGPLMKRGTVREYRHFVKHSKLARLVKINRFHGDIPFLMRRADAIVSMAGYNSCLEILQSGTPAVLMPRDRMRKEQSIRAGRLAEMGLVQTIPTGDPQALRTALVRALSCGTVGGQVPDLEGLGNLCDLFESISGSRFRTGGDNGRRVTGGPSE